METLLHPNRMAAWESPAWRSSEYHFMLLGEYLLHVRAFEFEIKEEVQSSTLAMNIHHRHYPHSENPLRAYRIAVASILPPSFVEVGRWYWQLKTLVL